MRVLESPKLCDETVFAEVKLAYLYPCIPCSRFCFRFPSAALINCNVFFQVCSSWFRLYLYTILGEGPVSMYIPKGTRLCSLPRVFWASSRLLLTTTAHEPVIVSIDCCLSTLNDTLQTHAVFLQVSFIKFLCHCCWFCDI